MDATVLEQYPCINNMSRDPNLVFCVPRLNDYGCENYTHEIAVNSFSFCTAVRHTVSYSIT